MAEEFIRVFNDDQKKAYKILKKALKNRKDKTGKKYFFVDGPGGSGKSFLYIALFYKALSKGMNLICMAPTGIASTLLPEGRTMHSTFALDVPLTAESVSRLKANSPLAKFIKEADGFILDEVSMCQNKALENMDDKLRELMAVNGIKSELPFGGKIILLGGDFRQILPVLKNGVKSEKIDNCLKKSYLWKYFKNNVLKLEVNERVRQALKSNNPEEAEDLQNFARYLLQVEYFQFLIVILKI
jgi:hypothetical protein